MVEESFSALALAVVHSCSRNLIRSSKHPQTFGKIAHSHCVLLRNFRCWVPVSKNRHFLWLIAGGWFDSNKSLVFHDSRVKE